MQIAGEKALGATLLFVASLAAVLIPYFIIVCRFRRQQKPPNKRVLSLLNCFAGGVFLGTTLLNLFPETQHLGETAMEKAELELQYPLTEFLITLSIFLTLLLEQAVHACSRRFAAPLAHAHSHDPPPSRAKQGKDGKRCQEGDKPRDRLLQNDTELSFLEVKQQTHQTECTKSPEPQESGSEKSESESEEPTVQFVLEPPSRRQIQFMGSGALVPRRGVAGLIYQVATGLPGAERVGDVLQTTEHDFIIALAKQGQRGGCRNIGIGSLLMTIALSLHTLFEGLAIGAQKSDSLMWTLLAAIAAHKVIVAVTVGVRLAVDEECSRGSAVVMAFVFSAGSPVGLVIGAVLTSVLHGVTGALTQWLLNCVASGTFVYVCVFEIIGSEMGNGHIGILQTLTMIAGFGILSGLAALNGDHGHDA